MRRSSWTPSVVRNGHDQNVYLVVDDFGRLGRAYCETDVEEADLETVITRLISGQFKDPICIVAFNTLERWSEESRKMLLGKSSAGPTSLMKI